MKMEIKDIILIAVIVLQSLLHYRERRDLYTRLMSKDLTDYNRTKSPPPKKHIPSAHERVLKRWRNKVGDE